MPIKNKVQNDLESMPFMENSDLMNEALNEMKNEESVFGKNVDRRVKAYFNNFKDDPDMCKIK